MSVSVRGVEAEFERDNWELWGKEALRVILNFHGLPSLPRRNYRVLQFRKQAPPPRRSHANGRIRVCSTSPILEQLAHADWRVYAANERVYALQGEILCPDPDTA